MNALSVGDFDRGRGGLEPRDMRTVDRAFGTRRENESAKLERRSPCEYCNSGR